MNPSDIHVHVKTNFIRNNDVVELRRLVGELETVLVDNGLLTDVVAGRLDFIEDQIEAMFGPE